MRTHYFPGQVSGDADGEVHARQDEQQNKQMLETEERHRMLQVRDEAERHRTQVCTQQCTLGVQTMPAARRVRARQER